MSDILSISSLIISSTTALIGIFTVLKLKYCHSLCCDAECDTKQNSPNFFNKKKEEEKIILKEPPKNEHTDRDTIV